MEVYDVDPRFGRCQHFIVVDPDSLDFEALEITSLAASGGAGIASAQVVAGKGVKAVLTGNCGPNAYQTLAADGIEVIVGVSGTVRNAIERYKSGSFEAASGPSVQGHPGIPALIDEHGFKPIGGVPAHYLGRKGAQGNFCLKPQQLTQAGVFQG